MNRALERKRKREAPFLKDAVLKDGLEIGVRLASDLSKRRVDSKGGFMFSDEVPSDFSAPNSPQMEPPPSEDAIFGGRKCQDCDAEFYESLLQKQFGLLVCESCRRVNEEKYSLATKTEAKQEYLLTDADLDEKEGGLRCIEKKNPQNERWGKMKLFLRFQVENISFTRYGGEEGLEKEIIRRAEDKLKLQEKKQRNKVSRLRKETFTGMWRKQADSHEHQFTEEQQKGGVWVKRCSQCEFEVEFEKM